MMQVHSYPAHKASIKSISINKSVSKKKSGAIDWLNFSATICAELYE